MTRPIRILHAIHDFLPRHLAGSERYAFELCQALTQRGHHVSVLCSEFDAGREHGSVAWREHLGLPIAELVNNWRFRRFSDTYASPLLSERLGQLLDALEPDVLHVHNLLNLSFDLPALARARGIPVAATLHDFTLVCPSGGQRVHRSERHVCVEIEPARCARCFAESPFAPQLALARLPAGAAGLAARVAAPVLRRMPGLLGLARRASALAPINAPPVADLEERLRRVADVYASVALFVAPSRALARDFVRFGLPEDKLLVSDNGSVDLPAAPRSAGDGRLRIGFVGTLTWHKGPHVLVEAARRLPRELAQVTLFGSTDTFPDYVAELRRLAEGAPVTFAGGFDPADAARIYAQLDVIVVPSLWPENSPLVIHEAFQAGVPVVGTRLGGIPELVEHGKSGLVYDGSPEELATILGALARDRARVAALAQGVPAVKGIAEDARDWEARYEMLRARA